MPHVSLILVIYRKQYNNLGNFWTFSKEEGNEKK